MVSRRTAAALGLALLMVLAGARLAMPLHPGAGPAVASQSATSATAGNVSSEPRDVVEARRRRLATVVLGLALFAWLTRRWP